MSHANYAQHIPGSFRKPGRTTADAQTEDEAREEMVMGGEVGYWASEDERAQQEVDVLRARIAELEADNAEQCRLNGLGASREARLLARIAELESNNARSAGEKEKTVAELYEGDAEAFERWSKQTNYSRCVDKRTAALLAWDASTSRMEFRCLRATERAQYAERSCVLYGAVARQAVDELLRMEGMTDERERTKMVDQVMTRRKQDAQRKLEEMNNAKA